jgi:hypothetical protein
MITSRSLHRLIFSAALLLLPLLSYCGEMTGASYPEVGPADQVDTLTTSVEPAPQAAQERKAALTRRILADMENRARSGL